jgi:hypothetical protein
LQKATRSAAACGILALALAAPAFAIEAGGIKFDDSIRLETQNLVANGAGVRSRFVFDVYAIALYLPTKLGSYDAIKGNNGAKRIAIHTLRDLSAQQFVDALSTGMQANSSEAELTALKPAMQQFADTLLSIKEVRKGTPISIDYAPQSGTRISVGGQPRGKDIAGEPLYDALLKIWLGDKPVQGDLKNKLLGN